MPPAIFKRPASFLAKKKLKAHMWTKPNTIYSIIMTFNIAPKHHSIKCPPKNWCLAKEEKTNSFEQYKLFSSKSEVFF